MRREYPEVYSIMRNDKNIEYGRAFSEPREGGLRRIKFWMINSAHGFGVPITHDQIDNVLNKLYELDYVVYAGYQGRNYKSRKMPDNGLMRPANFFEVFVK